MFGLLTHGHGPIWRPFDRLVWLKVDGFNWFRWVLFHLPGKPHLFLTKRPPIAWTDFLRYPAGLGWVGSVSEPLVPEGKWGTQDNQTARTTICFVFRAASCEDLWARLLVISFHVRG